MFGLFEREKRDIEKEKEIIDREVALYKACKEHDVDVSIRQYKEVLQEKVSAVEKACVRNTAEYEHKFHSDMEEKKVTLSKVVSDIEHKNEVLKMLGHSVDAFKTASEGFESQKALAEARKIVIEGKDVEIKNLNELVRVIVGKLPKVELDKLNINVAATSCPKENK